MKQIVESSYSILKKCNVTDCNKLTILWIAMASAACPDLDIAASTGVHTGEDAVKVLLAGVSAFEVCSAIYHNGLAVIDRINCYLSG